MKNTAIFFLLFSIVVFSGCKKDSDPSKTEMLSGKNWVVTAWTVDPPAAIFSPVPTANVYNQLGACSKDDITIFSKDGKVTFDEGATKCKTEDPQTTTGTWTFNPSETILSITSNGSTISYTIKSFTSNKIQTEYVRESEGTVYTFSFTMEAK